MPILNPPFVYLFILGKNGLAALYMTLLLPKKTMYTVYIESSVFKYLIFGKLKSFTSMSFGTMTRPHCTHLLMDVFSRIIHDDAWSLVHCTEMASVTRSGSSFGLCSNRRFTSWMCSQLVMLIWTKISGLGMLPGLCWIYSRKN